MKNEQILGTVLTAITASPGISLNGLMSTIGESPGGSAQLKNTQIFSAKRTLEASGQIIIDTRVKKNQGLYIAGHELPAEPIKVSFRVASTEPRKKKEATDEVVDASKKADKPAGKKAAATEEVEEMEPVVVNKAKH